MFIVHVFVHVKEDKMEAFKAGDHIVEGRYADAL